MPGKKSKKKKKRTKSERKQNKFVQSNNENRNNTGKEANDEPEAEENWDDEQLDPAETSQSSASTKEETGETCPSLNSTSYAGNDQDNQTLSAAVTSYEQSNVAQGVIGDEDNTKITQDAVNCDEAKCEKVNMNFYYLFRNIFENTKLVLHYFHDKRLYSEKQESKFLFVSKRFKELRYGTQLIII